MFSYSTSSCHSRDAAEVSCFVVASFSSSRFPRHVKEEQALETRDRRCKRSVCSTWRILPTTSIFIREHWKQEKQEITNDFGVSVTKAASTYRHCYAAASTAGGGGATQLAIPEHVDRLSSVDNAFVKHVVKLRQNSSYRHTCGSVVIVGHVPLRELCDIIPARLGRQTFIDYLFVPENAGALKGISEFANRQVHVTPSIMHKLSGLESSQQVEAIGIIPMPSSFLSLRQADDAFSALSDWCPSPQRLLVLDSIQDPGNLGTLLRTAAAFNWDGVFLMNCCDSFNDKALRASRGSCFWIPIACGHWAQIEAFAHSKQIKLLAGEPQFRTNGQSNHYMPISGSGSSSGVAAELNPQMMRRRSDHGQNLVSLLDIVDEDSLCLVLGSEGHGISEEVRAACNLVSIPMPGRFESLNVAVAGGIFLFSLQKRYDIVTKNELE